MKNYLVRVVYISICLLIVVYIFIYNSAQYNKTFENFFDHRFPVFNANTWIFNQNVAQYSTRALLTQQGTILVEALAFFNYDENEKLDYVKAKIRCIVFVDNKSYVLRVFEVINQITLVPSGSLTFRFLWKVRCELPQSQIHLRGKIKLALTDIDEYERLNSSDRFKSSKKYYLLSFQEANFYDLKIPKKKSVVHCVHMVRNLNEVRRKRMRNWLEIQKQIGIDRVRLYFARVDKTIETSLKDEFKDFIDIVPYRLEYENICKFSIQLKNNEKDREIINYIVDNCLQFYRVYFNESKVFMINHHEKICTNDCLLNFKYEYEFATNYDFDEFIFPRKFPTNDLSHFKTTSSCNNTSAVSLTGYNIYDYALKLTQKYGNQIACFQFENVAFLTIPESFSFINDFLNLPKRNIELKNSVTGDKLTLRVSPKDFDKIYEILDFEDMIKCLNKTIGQNEGIDSIWNMPFALLINNRDGKSLYNTNLTITFNQHHASHIETGARKFRVPMRDGYISHFREHFKSFLENQAYSFEHLYLDIEYYQFLANLSKKIKR